MIALSTDPASWSIGPFTNNLWVTGETWYAAHDVSVLLNRFDLKMGKPSWPVNRWLSAVVILFRPQIEELLQ